VETDPGKLQQILYNFLSNAVKFSPSGAEVGIAASRVEQDGGRAAVRISVIDRGPGVPADMQDVIFEKFRQVDASHTKRHGGTGLGLAICRELSEMLGATLSLRSAPGAGSTFSVEVPAAWTVRQRKPLIPAAGAGRR
jgi:signal transduction histidine kinase